MEEKTRENPCHRISET